MNDFYLYLSSYYILCKSSFYNEFQVRNERNKAREESKMLRTKLESALKETNAIKREKLEMETQNDQLKKEMERIHLLLLKHAGQWDHELLEALESEDPEHDVSSKTANVDCSCDIQSTECG